MRRAMLLVPLLFTSRLVAADLPVTETTVGRLALPVLPDSLVISPDSARIAFATNAGQVTLEDKGIFLKPPTGAAQEPNLPKNIRATVRLYIDDKSTAAYEVLTPVRFSPDSKRLAYAAQRDSKWQVIADNQIVVKDADAVPATPVLFSPDSKHLATIVQKGEKFLVTVDDKPWPPIDAFALGIPSFSPDGEHLAMVARVKATWVMFLDGKPLPVPPAPPPATRPAAAPATAPARFEHFGEFKWRPDSSGIVFYGAFLNAKWQVYAQTVDGSFGYTSSGFDGIMKGSPALNEEPPRIAFGTTTRGKWAVFTNEPSTPPSTSPDTPFDALRAESVGFLKTDAGPQLLTLAQRNRKWQMYVDRKPIGADTFDAIVDGSFHVSPDGKHYAFAGTRSGKAVIIRDGQPLATHDEAGALTFAFSSDSQHLAYAARNGALWFACIDGVAGGTGFKGLAAQPMAFSPTSGQIAFTGNATDNTWRLVVGKDATYQTKAYDSFIKGAMPVWRDDHTLTTVAIQKRLALRLEAKVP